MMKDGVVIFGQEPEPEEILIELKRLLAKLPCYGSIKTGSLTGRSLTGQILEIFINCDNVQLVIAQDRLNGNGEIIKVPETFTVPLASITQVWELPNPFNDKARR